MSVTKNIAVLTSGGDAPGMNAAIRAIVRTALNSSQKVFGVFEGYQGLVDGGDQIKQMDWSSVSGILPLGGTVIGSARCLDFRLLEGRRKAACNMILREIEVLIVVGGDGSLTGADIFRQEWPDHLVHLVAEGKITQEQANTHSELTIVGLVGSIDNDMYATDTTIGADTALQRAVESIDTLISTASSHRRSFVVEVMGRDCGYLALMAGLASDANWIMIPESPPPEDWEHKMVDVLKSVRDLGRRYCLVVVSEGAKDLKGKHITSSYVKQILDKAGHDTRITILGHTQRGGSPSVLDRYMSSLLGIAAVQTGLRPELRGKSCVLGTQGNNIVEYPLVETVEKTRQVGKLLANFNFDEAIKLRGSLFASDFRLFRNINRCTPHLEELSKPFRFAIFHVGEIAPGMNAAARTIVRLALDLGHKVYGFYNGFSGLYQNQFVELNWMDVEGWSTYSCANLGTFTRKNVPLSQDYVSRHFNIDTIIANITALKLDALIMIGGLEGYMGMWELYNAFQKAGQTNSNVSNISVVCIPATINNDLPATENSVGSDSALNVIVQSIDKIKATASCTQLGLFQKKPVLVCVEVKGGKCGYLASISGFAAGAELVHIPEIGVNVRDLLDGVELIKKRFSGGSTVQRTFNFTTGLLVRAEESSETYSTAFIERMFLGEAKVHPEDEPLFEVRHSVTLGDVQLGASPSPFDRILAARLANGAVQFLIQTLQTKSEGKAVCVGMIEGGIKITPLSDIHNLMLPQFTRPIRQWWYDFILPRAKLLSQ